MKVKPGVCLLIFEKTNNMDMDCFKNKYNNNYIIYMFNTKF